ncbi:MAG: Fe-S cluster assembly protein SufD [Chloroflexota bacterium]
MTTKTISGTKRIIRRTGPAEFPFTSEDARSVSQRLAEPAWLADRRLAAWEVWNSLPVPSVQDEPWRRTDLRAIPADRFVLSAAEKTPAPTSGETPGVDLVMRPGHPTGMQGHDGLRNSGVVFVDWASAVREQEPLLQQYLGTTVTPAEGKFSALAAALAADGVLLYVPKGVSLETPLRALLWAPGRNIAVFSRALIVIEAGASATLTYEGASPSEGSEAAGLHAGIVEVVVGSGAQLRLVEIQNWGDHVWNFTHERARVARDARIEWVFGAVGSHLTKNFSELNLEGQGAEGLWSGFFFADGVQHLDHDTQQNHLAPHTTSDLLFKGALVGRSRSVWQGMIYVAPGAQKTDGYQANRNLILSKKARADSIPGLEILADDVRCTHGATVSQLDEEPLFYIMSRGIPRPQAERLVVEGFFASVLERIPLPGVRQRFQQMIDSKLGASV